MAWHMQHSTAVNMPRNPRLGNLLASSCYRYRSSNHCQ